MQELDGWLDDKPEGIVCFVAQILGPSDEVGQVVREWIAGYAQRGACFQDEHWIYGWYTPAGDVAALLAQLQRMVYERCGADLCVAYAVKSGATGHDVMRRLRHKAALLALLNCKLPQEIRYGRDDWGIRAFRQARRAGLICTHQQPVVRLSDCSTVGYEYLARLRRSHDENQALPNAAWIGAVVGSFESFELFEAVLQQALQRLSSGQQQGYAALNMTALDMANPALLKRLREIPGEWRSRLVIELTEWDDVLKIRRIHDVFDELRSAGYRIALDDFGVAHSSLSVLRILHFDMIKLDISLTQSRHQLDEMFVDTVVRYAALRGMSVVAEGIESEELLQRPLARGIVYGQGFFIDRLLQTQPPQHVDVAQGALTTRALSA
ncbi:MAG: EAL domain-containing protein [Rhodocyclaceae bacterium]|nr:EAL domain-containing protein [Rhodocyclaceae bacterium]